MKDYNNKDFSTRPVAFSKLKLRTQTGASMIEYALVLALILAIAIPSLTILGEGVRDSLEFTAKQLAAVDGDSGTGGGGGGETGP